MLGPPELARRSRLVSWLLLAGGVAIFSSCSLKAPKQSQLMRQDEEITITAQELRIMVRSLATPITGQIETAADRGLRSADPETRRALILWKINGIPAMHAALFQPDPLAAYLDAWALSVQMQLYFTEGPGAGWRAEVRAPAPGSDLRPV